MQDNKHIVRKLCACKQQRNCKQDSDWQQNFNANYH